MSHIVKHIEEPPLTACILCQLMTEPVSLTAQVGIASSEIHTWGSNHQRYIMFMGQGFFQTCTQYIQINIACYSQKSGPTSDLENLQC